MTQKQIIKKAFETYPINNVRNSLGYMYDENRDKREGYIQALTEMESMVKLQGWIVRDKDSELKGEVWLSIEKPRRFDDIFWVSDAMFQIQNYVFLNEKFPELTWESEPVKVELIIRTI